MQETSQKKKRKLTIKISELVFPAIAKRKGHVKLQTCKDEMFFARIILSLVIDLQVQGLRNSHA